CTGLFAGIPAPTESPQGLKIVQTLWERVYPRRGRPKEKPRHVRNAVHLGLLRSPSRHKAAPTTTA
ncbi:hypothetical protein, partial [Pseudomonas putida]|uniref:hypothetical protein n=1 Tax=Pseudomonas putida TaxID=303 RepID=UPI0023649352